MAIQWFLQKKIRHQRRIRAKAVRLHAEPLESRSLLSASTPLPLNAVSASPAVASVAAAVSSTSETSAVARSLVMGLSERVTAGVPVTVALSARNARNQPVTNYSRTVTLASSDRSAVLPVGITFVNGYATFQVTFRTSGNQTLTAADNSATPLVATKQTSVAAPLAAASLVMGLSERVTAGVPVTVVLSARNAQNQPVTNYSRTVTLTSSDRNVVLPTSITFVNGYASFQVTFKTSGNQTLTATDNSATPLTATKPTSVSVRI